MKLSGDQVRHVAALARLDLSEAEIETLSVELSAILDYIDKLGELDTGAVEPTTSVVAMKAAMREDVVTNPCAPERTLANAPESRKGHFVVPRIIE